LIVEDIGAVVDSDWQFTQRLPHRARSREDLAVALGRTATYLAGSFRRSGEGWILLRHRRHRAVAKSEPYEQPDGYPQGKPVMPG
jgi:hypothetical protein